MAHIHIWSHSLLTSDDRSDLASYTELKKLGEERHLVPAVQHAAQRLGRRSNSRCVPLEKRKEFLLAWEQALEPAQHNAINVALMG
jgi:hypothetical protein